MCPISDQPTAAVAVVITRINPSVLLVRRAEHPADPWSGHWALPGGRREDEDTDLVATCRREVQEECGCLLSPETLVRPLPLSSAGRSRRTPVIVAPYLWNIPSRIPLVPDNDEIVSARWLSLSWLSDPENHRTGRIAPRYVNREFPYVLLEDTPLWGFTYRVLMDYLNPDLA